MQYSISREKTTFVIAACSLVAAAMTRYIGTAVLLASVLCVFFFVGGTFKERLGRSAALGLITGLPISLWMYRNWRLTGAFTNRTFQVHPVDVDTLRSLLDVIFDWVTARYLSHWVEGALLILFISGVLACAVLRISRSPQKPNRISKWVVLLVVFVSIYLAQLMVSLSFFDASTRINNRILSPVYLSIGLMIFLTAASTDRKKINALLTVGLLVILVLCSYPRMLDQSMDIVNSVRFDGAGFASAGWRDSELISFIRTRESAPIIVTNQAMAVRFLTDNPAIQIPERWDPVKDQERDDYRSELNAILSQLNSPNSYVVLFRQSDISVDQDLDWLVTFTLVFEGENGSIYTHQNSG
jgi:hypothetical protein